MNQPTITWKVTNLDCYPTYQQNTDVVFTVHWDCLGNIVVATGSLSGSVYNSRLYGTTGVHLIVWVVVAKLILKLVLYLVYTIK